MSNELCRQFVRILGEHASGLKRFFDHIDNNGHTCTVFITRRCYILYLLYRYMFFEGEELIKRDTIFSDSGIFIKRDILSRAEKIDVVDDIGMHGASMHNVVKRVAAIAGTHSSIHSYIYLINQNENVKDNIINNIEKDMFFSCIYELPDYNCQQISSRFTNFILSSGFPFTTFVYSIFGTAKSLGKIESMKELDDISDAMSRYRWKTKYAEDKTSELYPLRKISRFLCLRQYADPADTGLVLSIPFPFMKSIHDDRMGDFFSFVEKQIGSFDEGLSNKIRDIVKEVDVNKHNPDICNEAFLYIINLYVALCTRVMCDQMKLDDLYNDILDVSLQNLKGSFSPDVINLIKNWKSEYSEKFVRHLNGINDDIFYCVENSLYVYYEKLKDYILSMNHTDIFQEMSMVFRWMRDKYEEDASNKNTDEMIEYRMIETDCLFNLFEESYHAEREKIYYAMIYCWDSGIASYRFKYIEGKGIVSFCGFGEGSAYVIQDFFFNELNDAYAYMMNSHYSMTKDNMWLYICNLVKKKNEKRKYIDELKKEWDKKRGIIYELLV